MRRILLGHCLGLLSIFIASQTFAQSSPDKMIESVEAANAKINTFAASFKQIYNDIAAGSSKVSKGSVYLKKPHRLRWIAMDAKDPKSRDKEFISDGVTFWSYEHALSQVYVQCLKDGTMLSTLKTFMGQGNFKKRFTVDFSKKSTKATPELTLIPKKKTSHYTKVNLTLDPKTFQITKTVIFDPYGNSTEYIFSEVKINRKLPDSGFIFNIPKNVRLLSKKRTCP